MKFCLGKLTDWFLVGNGGMDFGITIGDLNHRDPFPHSLLRTRELMIGIGGSLRDLRVPMKLLEGIL